jgi:hypothetical protein
MTPKEKAEELFNKYCIYLRAGLLYDDEAREDAKQCTLIAIDELIEEQEIEQYNNGTCYRLNYWNEVKQEIEKIII